MNPDPPVTRIVFSMGAGRAEIPIGGAALIVIKKASGPVVKRYSAQCARQLRVAWREPALAPLLRANALYAARRR